MSCAALAQCIRDKMKSPSLSHRYLSAQLCLSAAFCAAVCQAQTATPKAQSSAFELAKRLQQQSVSLELEGVPRDNVFKDLRITAAGVDDPSGQHAPAETVRAAATAYEEALKADPNNPELHADLARLLAELGQAEAAQKELERALEINPKFAAAHNHLGIHYLLKGEKARAEQEFKAAIETEPRFAEAKNNLGCLYVITARSSEALQLFRQALADRPNYLDALVNLGFLRASQSDFADAEKSFRAVLRLSPDSVAANNALAATAIKLGHGEDAITVLQRVARLRPNSAVAHANLGIALAAEGFDLPGASEQLTEAIRLDPGLAVAHYHLGRVLLETSRRDEARKELRSAHHLEPDNPDVLYLLAQLERQSGEIAASVQLLDHLVTLAPQNSDAQYLLGRNLLLLGKTDEAIHHLQLAVAAKPDNLDALYNLAQTLGKTGDQDAKVYLQRFQDLKQGRQLSDRVEKLGSYALEAAHAHDWPKAIADFKEAIELCLQCASAADLHRNLGVVYVLAGKPDLGREELEAALKLRPDDADARRALESLAGHKADPR